MRTLKARTKAKKKGEKFSTINYTMKDASSSFSSSSDLSQLRKPIDISVCSLLQVTKLLDTGSDEIKDILAYECDIIYECRICRSLFRSLANFISHKRVYCKEKYNITFNRKALDNILGKKTVVDLEPQMEVGFADNESNERMLRSQVPQKDLNLDLTSVMDMIQEKQCDDTERSDLRSNECKSKSTEIICDNQQILLEALSSTQSAVYQTVTENTLSTVHTADLMKAQIIELQNMMNKNTAVLGPSGRCIDMNQAEKTDNFFQSCDNNDNIEIIDANTTDELICPICKGEFATKKTLAHHMKSQHTSYKIIYSCPCCSNSFRNTWSVYRHLYKVHRKSNEQVRKLRNQIQDKAYRKVCLEDQQPMEQLALHSKDHNKKQKMIDENQEWMIQVESDSELQRCGGCGRRFDRKAALQSHLQLCQRRIAVCNGSANKAKKLGKIPSVENVFVRNNSAKVIAEASGEISYSSKANKESSLSKSTARISTEPESQDAGMVLSQQSEGNELLIRVDKVLTLSTADWEMMGTNTFKEKDSSTNNSNKSSNKCSDKESCSAISDKDLFTSTAAPKSPEILYTRIDASQPNSVIVGSKRRKIDMVDSGKESAMESDIPLQRNSLTPPDNSTISTSSASTKSNSTTVESSATAKRDSMNNSSMKYDISTISNIRKLQCLKCRRKFASITNLRRHMAVHMGWNRYSCTLCDFKCFVKCDCFAHCNKVHNAKNNRALLEQLVVPISQEEDSSNQPLVIDIATNEDTSADLEIVSVTTHRSNEGDHTVFDNTTPVDKVDAMKETTSTPEKRSFEAESNSATLVESIDETRDTPRNNSFEETQDSLRRENESDSDCNESNDFKQDRRDTSLEKLQNINDTSPQFLAQSTLDGNPDLKRMVMEVIFGTGETADVSNSNQDQIDSISRITTKRMVTNDESANAIKMASTNVSNSDNTLNIDLLKKEKNIKDQESPKKDDPRNKDIFNHDQLRPQRSMRRVKLTSCLTEQTPRRDNVQKSVPYSLSKNINAKLLTDKIPTVVICRADTVRGLCNIKKMI